MARVLNGWLVASVGLLLLQFFLRSHDIMAMPGYADESHHIRRAEVTFEFTRDPIASTVPGKLLLYYYLAFFETERVNYLHISRLAIALFALLSAACLNALGTHLFDRRVGLVAQAVYTLLPFTLFYERMALADPFTTGLMLLSLWVGLLWFRTPTDRMSVLLGIILILPPLAKLTSAALCIFPVLLVLLFSGEPFPYRRYWRQGLIMYGIFGVFWLIIFTPVVLAHLRGERIVFIGDYLLNIHEQDQGFVANLADNFWQSIQQTAVLVSSPALLIMVIGGLLLLWRSQRHGILLWVLLAGAWLPTIVLGSFPSSRYLLIGMPFLILMGVAGLYQLLPLIRAGDQRRLVEGLLLAGVLMYGLIWGVPFWEQAVTEAQDVNLPEEARWRFIQSTTAAYGQIDAIQYFEREGEISPVSRQVEVYAILGSCHLMRLHMEDPGLIHLTCVDLDFITREIAPDTSDQLLTDLARHGAVYLLLERGMSINVDDLPVQWQYVRLFERPHDGEPIELWQVSPAGADDQLGLPPRP